MKKKENITPFMLDDNIFKLISKDWMLITAGDRKKCNTMTASFGGFGVLFFKNVAQIYVRPERYTYEFLEQNPQFSLSFFDEAYRGVLQDCGRTSGRDVDKIAKNNLEVLYTDDDTPYFSQAKVTIICKKIYAQDLSRDCFIDKQADEKTYSSGGVHRMYVGEILKIFK